MKPTYDSNLIINSDVVEQSFNANGESNECLYCINEYGIKASTNKNSAYIPSDKCVPVRICLHIEDNTENWVKYGSPINEIDFGNVLKYWPAEILDSKTGDQITIEYPDFIINAKVINNKEILTMKEEVKDETVEEIETKEESKKTKIGKKLPKWAIAAIIGTATAVGVGVISGIVLKKKKADNSETESEDAAE